MLYLGARSWLSLRRSSAGPARRRNAQEGETASAAAAHAPGQHGQQCAGSQEPGCRGPAEDGAAGAGATDPALQNATPRSRPRLSRLRPEWATRSMRPWPALRATGATRSNSFHRQHRRSSSSRRRTGNLPYDSQFASNLVYTRAPDQPSQKASLLPWRIVQAQPARSNVHPLNPRRIRPQAA